MNQIEKFYEAIKNNMDMILATASNETVNMRTVSPVFYDGSILIFTSPYSAKYRQLTENPNCCIEAGGFFAETKASFLGKTMDDKNEVYRNAYSKKFPGAFDEGIAFGGRSAEFILLKPIRLKGWDYENDNPTHEGIPTIPFEIFFDGAKL